MLSTNSSDLSATLSSPILLDITAPLADPHVPPIDYLHLPITLHKGMCYYIQHPISHFVSYDCLYPIFGAFAFSMTSESIPQLQVEALQAPIWKTVMGLEIRALIFWGT